MKSSLRILTKSILAFCAISFGSDLSYAAPLIKAGETVAFLGDSITEYGSNHPFGYVRLVEQALEINDTKITVIPAGISGHKSNQMLARLEKDVLSKKPQWMTLSCGVNDVWHGPNGVPLDDYKKNITSILDQCEQANIKVIILTATQIRLPLDNPPNTKLAAYNDFLRDIAKSRNIPLADVSADMVAEQKSISDAGKTRVLTEDGVHMNPFGDMMMAKGVLRAMGLSAPEIAKAEAKWRTSPNAFPVRVAPKVSLEEYEKLEAAAAAAKQTLEDWATNQTATQLRNSALKP